MRRIIRGKPLLVVTAAATASAIAGCTAPSSTPIDGSDVSGNLDSGFVHDASWVSGNLDAGVPFFDANRRDVGVDASVVSGNLALDVGPTDAATDDAAGDAAADAADADVDGGS